MVVLIITNVVVFTVVTAEIKPLVFTNSERKRVILLSLAKYKSNSKLEHGVFFSDEKTNICALEIEFISDNYANSTFYIRTVGASSHYDDFEIQLESDNF